MTTHTRTDRRGQTTNFAMRSDNISGGSYTKLNTHREVPSGPSHHLSHLYTDRMAVGVVAHRGPLPCDHHPLHSPQFSVEMLTRPVVANPTFCTPTPEQRRLVRDTCAFLQRDRAAVPRRASSAGQENHTRRDVFTLSPPPSTHRWIDEHSVRGGSLMSPSPVVVSSSVVFGSEESQMRRRAAIEALDEALSTSSWSSSDSLRSHQSSDEKVDFEGAFDYSGRRRGLLCMPDTSEGGAQVSVSGCPAERLSVGKWWRSRGSRSRSRKCYFQVSVLEEEEYDNRQKLMLDELNCYTEVVGAFLRVVVLRVGEGCAWLR